MRPRSLPPLVPARQPDWALIIAATMENRACKGEAWPAGTAEAIAAMIPSWASEEQAISLVVDELEIRDVGGRHTFVNGAGI